MNVQRFIRNKHVKEEQQEKEECEGGSGLSAKEKHIAFDYNKTLIRLERLFKSVNKSKTTASRIRKKQLTVILSDDTIKTNQILRGEVEKLIEYESEIRHKERANANFDLLFVLKANKKQIDSELDRFIEIGKPINLRLSPHERRKAIHIYKKKKKNRKNLSYIRYSVRKELASKRLRHKGKFIKKPRINLQTIINELFTNG